MEFIVAGDGFCRGKCAKTFIETLEERQDVCKGLERTDGPQLAQVGIAKERFAAWIEMGGTFDDLCLFVSHQLLHLYCYSEVTLIGRGHLPIPHVLRHDDWSRQLTFLQAMKSSVEHKYHPCCPQGENSDLFDVIYVYKPFGQTIETSDVTQAPSMAQANALVIRVVENEHELTFTLQFPPTSNGSQSKSYVSINQLISTAEHLLNQVAQNPTLEVRDLHFVPPSHSPLARLQPVDFAIYKSPFPTMAAIFEAQVDRVPSKTGLVVGEKRFTYAEINERANQVRNAILATSTASNSNDIIALCLDRTELIIFAILGVWKAGCAYVPIDPNYPAARMSLILNDCRPIIILTDESSRSKLPPEPCPVLNLSDAAALEKAAGRPYLHPSLSRTDLALVIYTSGTTGQPKGVMIEQSSLVSQCEDYGDRYPDLTEDDVVLHLFNYAFNAFMEPVTLAFSRGLCLLMVPFQILLEPAKLLEHLRVNGVTHIDGTPSLASQYNLARVTTLKRVAVGGEPLTSGHHSTFLRNNPRIRVYNIYGNSEGTLCTLTADVTSSDSFEFSRQVRNKRVYLVSSGMRIVPPGAIGEVCLAGAGIARGYLNNPDLTNQKFLRNPFRTESEIENDLFPVLYRTGDLAVESPRGGISIIGRKDLQVKIRGMRVEISEIENGILKFPGVSKAAVIWSQEASGNQLIGFIMGELEPGLGSITEKVKGFLLESFPEYMVPSRIVHLPNFPLTPNGKIDRNQLHALVSPTLPTLAPENLEIRQDSAEVVAICEIWEEVLSLPPNSVDRTTNFFSLGGNSLLAIKVLSIIFEKLGFQLNASKIMESGGSFESFLTPADDETSSEGSGLQIPLRTPDSPAAPLSTSQERIWSSRQNPLNHISFIFEVARGDLKVNALLDRISGIVNKHEIFRSIYPVGRFGMKVQKVLGEVEVVVAELEGESSLAEFITKPFDLSGQIPLRVGTVLEPPGKVHQVVIVVHSIAMDSPGQTLFLEELSQSTSIPREPMRGVQYGDYALFQKNFIPGEDEKMKMAYWREFMNSQLPSRISKKNDEFGQEFLEFSLDQPLSQALREMAQKLGTSLYGIFLSAQMILQNCIDPSFSEVRTGTFHFARDQAQLYKMAGNFTHLVPLSVEMDPKESVSNFIRRVGGVVKEAKAMQSFPIDMTIAAVGGTRNLIKQGSFKFLFHAGSFPQPGIELNLDGSVLRLVEVKRDFQILEGTTQLFIQVDTAVGNVKLWKSGRKESAEEIKRLFHGILDKMVDTGVGTGNGVIGDFKFLL